MNFSELLEKRRSIRDYQKRPVPLEVIQEIIKETCLAPSSGNGQPWQFIVVNDREWVRRLSEESKKNFLAFLAMNPSSPLKKYEASLQNKEFNVFYNAPSMVYIGGPKDLPSLVVDCTLAAGYFMFAAAARGLGTCWIHLGSDNRDPEIQKGIGMPEGFRIVAPLALGYPQAIPQLPVREPKVLKIVEP